MDRLWAPWRMEYILNEKPAGCIFCVGNDPTEDQGRLILHRASFSFVMLNRYPYTNGHLLVVPYRHTSDLNDLSHDEMCDLLDTVRLSRNVLESAAGPQGYNVGLNLGKAAGAGVDEHLHFHVVPRWNGDTNYMSVIADVRIMPENLMVTYDKLSRVFRELS